MRRTGIRMTLLIVAALFLLVGGIGHAKTKIVVHVWGDEKTPAAWGLDFNAFMKENPDIDIDIIAVGAYGQNYYQRLAVSLAAGQQIDVYIIEPETAVTAFQQGLALDLSSLLESDPKFQNDLVVEPMSIKGIPYGIGATVLTRPFPYHRDRFDQMGLETPTSLWKNGRWTYDAMGEAALKLTEVNSEGFYTFLGLPLNGWIWGWAPWVAGFGGRIVSDDGREAYLDDPKTIEAFRWVQGLAKSGLPVSYRRKLESGNWRQLEAERKMGMFSDTGSPLDYKNGKIDHFVGWVPYPTGPSGKNPAFTGQQPWAIAANTDHPQEAYRVLKYIVRAMGSHSAHWPPNSKSAMANYLDQFRGIGLDDLDPVWNELLSDLVPRPSFADGGVAKVISDALEKLEDFEADPETILPEINRQINGMLAD